MAERQLPKLNVAGSIPVSRSKKISSSPRCCDSSNCLLIIGVIRSRVWIFGVIDNCDSRDGSSDPQNRSSPAQSPHCRRPCPWFRGSKAGLGRAASRTDVTRQRPGFCSKCDTSINQSVNSVLSSKAFFNASLAAVLSKMTQHSPDS